MDNYKIGIIGAGKVGCALAIGLEHKGIRIDGLFTRSLSSLDYVNDKLDRHFNNDLDKTVNICDVIFIAVSDSELEYVTKQIINGIKDRSIKNKIFFHLSGALDSDELNLLSWQGAYTGSLHPIQTFADKKDSWKGLDNIYYGFEGSNQAKIVAAHFIKLFSGQMILLKKESKKLYHIAACFLSNYLVALAYASEELFKLSGMDGKIGLEAFKPLVVQTIENIHKIGTINSLTGPVARGDTNTIAEHITALYKNDSQFIELYNALGKVATDIALKKKTIDKHQYERMKNMFKIKKDEITENNEDIDDTL